MGGRPDGTIRGGEIKSDPVKEGQTDTIVHVEPRPSGADNPSGKIPHDRDRPDMPKMEGELPLDTDYIELDDSDVKVHGNSPAGANWIGSFGMNYFGRTGPVYGITPADFVAFMSETNNQARGDYVVVDLRNRTEEATMTEQIKGAVHLPVYTSWPDKNTSAYEVRGSTMCYNWSGLAGDARGPDLWHTTEEDEHVKSGDWAHMKYIFFHCSYGVTRTPLAALGYHKFVGSKQPLGTKVHVIVLETGFNGLKGTQGSAICFEPTDWFQQPN